MIHVPMSLVRVAVPVCLLIIGCSGGNGKPLRIKRSIDLQEKHNA